MDINIDMVYLTVKKILMFLKVVNPICTWIKTRCSGSSLVSLIINISEENNSNAIKCKLSNLAFCLNENFVKKVQELRFETIDLRLFVMLLGTMYKPYLWNLI